jgi:hypothetical protein
MKLSLVTATWFSRFGMQAKLPDNHRLNNSGKMG